MKESINHISVNSVGYINVCLSDNPNSIPLKTLPQELAKHFGNDYGTQPTLIGVMLYFRDEDEIIKPFTREMLGLR